MATYKQIQDYIEENFGYTPKTCWIAHMKELRNLSPKASPNRLSPTERKHPCPSHKQDDLRRAFRHFKMIED